MNILLVLLVVLVLVLIVGIVLLVRQLRQAQQAEAIESTLRTQADADIERSTPGELAEMQSLKDELLAAIETLKSSGKKAGEDALAKLPWYMVIGPAGAGKSELIRRSGLQFPLHDAANNPRAVRGVGGTRSFSWWLAHEAVLLDMAGRTLATAAFDDSGDWLSFLAMLRKQRPERPIHGVVVVVAIDQIADQPEARVDSIARAARERIEELVKNLGVVFPVYVIFNRCDQVTGFAEFFEDLGAEQRREPWGATLSLERARSFASEVLFDEEFGVLLASLSERRVSRMAAMPEAVTRARSFVFPLQFDRVRGNLRRFVRTLFEHESGADAPPFRGFYFTAAAQSGEPTDRVMQPAVRNLGLSVRQPEGFTPPHGGASFVRDLFTEVVFPDKALVTSSRGAQGTLKKRDRVLIGSFGLAFGVLTLLFAGLSCYNGAIVSRTRRAAEEVATRVRPDAPIVENLRALEKLRVEAHTLDSLRTAGVPIVRKLGGWSGDAVREPAVKLWMDRSVASVVGLAARQMEVDLRQQTDANTGDFLQYYFLFRAWRLLGEPTQITPDDADILANEVTRALQSRLSTGAASAEDRRRYPELVRRQMRCLCEHPDALAPLALQYRSVTDPDLVARASRRVHDTWASPQFYAQLIADAAHDSRPATFESLAGKSALMSGAVTVPGPFTKDGWANAVKPRIEGYRKLVKRDLVLQDVFQQNPPDLAGDLMNLYAKDYAAHWAAFLDGVSLRAPNDMGSAAEMLANIAKGDSPMFKVLRAVRDQTQFGVAADAPLGRVQKDFAMLKDFFETSGGGGDKAMGFMQRLMPGKKEVDALDKTQSASAKYQFYLQQAQAAINKAAQPGAPAANIRNLIASGDDTTNPLRALAAFAGSFVTDYASAAGAAPMSRLLGSPIGGAKAAVVSRGLNPALAAAWKAQVYDPFMRTLGGRYPFAASREDASLNDFAACFSSKGYFWAFYTQNLAPYLNEDGSAKGPDVPVSGGMVEFLKKAYEIRQDFFAAGDSPKLDFTVSATPPRIDGPSLNVPWVSFDCGGARVTYNMGPQSENAMSWPGADPTAGAGVRANASTPIDPKHKPKKGESDAINVEAKTGEGLWGVFRLVDAAQSVTESGPSSTLTWSLAAGSSHLGVTWDLKGPTSRSPFARGFLRMSLPAGP